jgi:aerobic carbon-monoxide dehydrogenase small subunit
MNDSRRVQLEVNGRSFEQDVPVSETLLVTLRDRLGLHSVRGSCGIGICGTCTVLVGGAPISSCISLTALNDGRSVLTSEGLSGDESIDAVQQAFIDNNAFQCSYCIPAMVLTVRAYLDEAESPSLDDAKAALAGNLCRCGSYPNVLEAVADLIQSRTSPDGPPAVAE